MHVCLLTSCSLPPSPPSLIPTFLQISLLEFNLSYNFPERSFLILSGENNEVNINDCQELARLQSV